MQQAPALNDNLFNSAAFQGNNSLPMRQYNQTPFANESQSQRTSFQRPPSQATSVKADMGSTSASVVNRVIFFKLILIDCINL